MLDFFFDLITTMIGVITGGLITIGINNLTNTKLLRKNHELDILQDIKALLNDWRHHLLLDVTTALTLPK